MRTARKRMIGKGCLYHCMNRIAGPISDLPFTDVDKEKAFLLLEELSTYFLIEVISVCILDNHWHAVLYAPGETPSLKDAAARHNAFYGTKKVEISPSINPERCAEVASQIT